VDDKSPNGTDVIADSLARDYGERVQVIHRPGKQGLRSAYLAGFRQALELKSDAIILMDADFSHDPAVLGNRQKGSIHAASRLAPDISKAVHLMTGGRSSEKVFPLSEIFMREASCVFLCGI
jgi:glycosyltransferase involved in cell wall biosynthesis